MRNVPFAIFAGVLVFRYVLENFVRPKTTSVKPGGGVVSLALMVVGHVLAAMDAGYHLYFRPETNLPLFGAGLALVVAGFAGRIIVLRQLGGSYSVFVEKTEGSRLVTHGLYALVRHPLYGLWLVELAGFALIAPDPVTAGAFVMVLLPTLYRIGWEERLLEQWYPDEFRAYRKNTKRLIPFVY